MKLTTISLPYNLFSVKHFLNQEQPLTGYPGFPKLQSMGGRLKIKPSKNFKNIEIDPKNKLIYIRLQDGLIHKTIEYKANVLLDLSKNGSLLGIEFLILTPNTGTRRQARSRRRYRAKVPCIAGKTASRRRPPAAP